LSALSSPSSNTSNPMVSRSVGAKSTKPRLRALQDGMSGARTDIKYAASIPTAPTRMTEDVDCPAQVEPIRHISLTRVISRF
jgi:hypothetical protein